MSALWFALSGLLIQLIELYKIVIIISAVLSFVSVDRNNQIVVIIEKLTQPVYKKINSIVNMRYSGMDFSPLFVLFTLTFVEGLLH